MNDIIPLGIKCLLFFYYSKGLTSPNCFRAEERGKLSPFMAHL